MQTVAESVFSTILFAGQPPIVRWVGIAFAIVLVLVIVTRLPKAVSFLVNGPKKRKKRKRKRFRTKRR